MEILFWVVIFIISLGALVKGAQWFLHGAERIGLKFGMSPFVIGVLIVGIGTSLPELISAIAAVLRDVNEIVVANAVGSNIANILLVIGAVAIIGRKIEVKRDLIDLELPLLAISTVLFLMVVLDGFVSPMEAVVLFAAFLIYLFYSLSSGESDASPVVAEESARVRALAQQSQWGIAQFVRNVVLHRDNVLFIVGIAGILLGAQYLIESVIQLSGILNITPALISITAIAIGTSLPELFVSGRAVLDGKSEVAIGNILGSSAFNALVVVGIPGLFGTLYIDERTLKFGIPFMAIVVLLFIIVGISKRIYHWEGMMFILLYVLFILKLFGII